MIAVDQIQKLVNEKISGTDIFIVEAKVKSGNKIEVLIDRTSGLGINDCIDVSRHIEKSLDREKEDFELVVSSPGAEAPLKMEQQYIKNIGRNASVVKADGTKHTGVIIDFKNDVLTLEETRRENKKIGKGKETVTEQIKINKSEIKETKLIISFK